MATGIATAPASCSRMNIAVSQNQTLGDALQTIGGDAPSDIPLVVRLLENPASPIALPGKIDLYRHDCLHLLLNRGFSLEDEAFVVGFTMGNDKQTRPLHLIVFKLCSWLLYPKPYRFHWTHFKTFDRGVACGRSVKTRNLNTFDFKAQGHKTIAALRHQLDLDGQ